MRIASHFLLFSFLFLALLGKAQELKYSKESVSNNLDSAIAYLKDYISNVKRKQDTAELINANCLLASKLSYNSKQAKAIKLLDQCIGFPFIRKNPLLLGRVYLEKGNVYRSEESYTESLENYLKAKAIFEELREWKYYVRCETNLAEYYRKLNKFPMALEYIRLALKNYSKYELKDTALLIRIHNRTAALDNEYTHNTASIIYNSRRAIALARLSNDVDAQATSLNEIGFTYKNMLKLDSAEMLYKEAERLWLSIGFKREALHVMNNRAMLYAHNRYGEDLVKSVYMEMINLVNKDKVDYNLSDVYGQLHTYSIMHKDTGRAYKHFYLYHSSILSSLFKQHDAKVANITEKYESEKAKREVKQVKSQLVDSKAENTRIYIYLIVVIMLFGFIVYLLVRIQASNKKLKERNFEKDTLIQEIHHRVKNNIQFISSLVNMQMNTSSSDVEVHSLSDASRRIKAMALVHEMLYNQKETTGISIKQYLEELISSLNDVVNSDKLAIKFNLQIQEVNFNVSNSIALGMITSELVSNSMKHAFKGVEFPMISIVLESKEKEVVLVVSDNGNGISNVLENKKTLGMRLIDIFSRQLKGKYSIASENGCKYEINFALN